MEALNSYNQLNFTDLKPEEKKADIILSNVVEALCYNHGHKIFKQAEKLHALKETLEMDLNALEAARYYYQPKQKQWLDNLGLAIKNSLKDLTLEKSKVMGEKKTKAIDFVKKIYESNNEELIEKFKELLEQRYQQAKQKLSVVEQSLSKITTPKDMAMQRGYSNIFMPAKDKEGFAIPLSKNTQEKKRELKDQKSEQSSKRRMLEPTPQKEKENSSKNNQFSSSSHEEQNNGYQAN